MVTHISTKISSDLPQADGSVSTDARLVIIGGFCQVPQELAIDYAI